MQPATPATAARSDVNQAGAACRRTVLVVDHHPLYRAGLIWALAPLPIRCGEAGKLAAALEALERESVSLILYDWHLPDGGGCKGLAAISRAAPRVPVIVISADDDEAIDVAARFMGAAERVTKANDAERIRAVVSRILRCTGGAPPTAAGKVEAGTPAATIELTQRQRDVLRQMASGQPNKRIATTLGIADSTVRAHVSDILRLMRARNRTEAVIHAHREHVLALGGR